MITDNKIKIDQTFLDALQNSTQFLTRNNMKIVELRERYARIELDVDEYVMNELGIVHGGVIFTLADNTAAASDVAQGRSCVTLNSTINYLRPATGTKLIAISETVHLGKTTGVYDVSIYNDQDVLVAKGLFTMYFLGDRAESMPGKVPASK